MSILIKSGMKYPKCCHECLFHYDVDMKFIAFENVIDATECNICDGYIHRRDSLNSKLPDCPLVEIQ